MNKKTDCPKLTDEQKKQFAPYLHSTWNYLSADAGEFLNGESKKNQLAIVVELTTDADRLTTIGQDAKKGLLSADGVFASSGHEQVAQQGNALRYRLSRNGQLSPSVGLSIPALMKAAQNRREL